MLEPLLGNATVEKVLLYLNRYRQGYAKGMADCFSLPLVMVQKQLKRLEDGNVLVSRMYGRTRLYEWNPRYLFLKELARLLDKAFAFLPQEQIERFYMRRTRPRRIGKPL
ncbi:ArsR family transcriptional regulator [candidate division FCPU426 bacterium]|nr:ArsR family transcriptional regulator [candidate division FCPU426 bacterium]